MNIKWTPKRIASLDIVKRIHNLPFEVGILFGLYDNGYTIFFCKPGNLYSTKFPSWKLLKLFSERKKMQLAYVHNHPNILGDGCLPSGADVIVMKRKRFLCKLLGIKFFDALSVGQTGEYYSFKENKLF